MISENAWEVESGCSTKRAEDFYFKLSTLYFGICKLQSLIAWCDIVKMGKNLQTLQVPFGKKEGITDAECYKN